MADIVSHSPNSSTHNPLNTIVPEENFSVLLLRFLNFLKKTGKSSNTIAAYRNDLSLYLEFCQEQKIRPSECQIDFSPSWSEFLKERGRTSQASQRRSLMSIRSFMKFLISHNKIENSGFLNLKSPRQPTHDLLTLTVAQVDKLLGTLKRNAKSQDEKKVRDYCIVLVICKFGIKVSELCALKWGDIVPVFTKKQVMLRIKGEKERVIFGDKTSFDAFEMLKAARTNLGLKSLEAEPLFFGFQNVGRKLQAGPLHRHGVKFVLYELTNSLIGTPFNAESLRNFCISQWLNSGVNREKVAELAGYNTILSLERFSLNIRKTRKSKRRMKSEGN